MKETFRQEAVDVGDFAGNAPWIPEDKWEDSKKWEGMVWCAHSLKHFHLLDLRAQIVQSGEKRW